MNVGVLTLEMLTRYAEQVIHTQIKWIERWGEDIQVSILNKIDEEAYEEHKKGLEKNQ